MSLKLMDLIVLDKQDFILERLNTEELFSLLAGSLKPMLEERKAMLHPYYTLFPRLCMKARDSFWRLPCGNIQTRFVTIS